MSDATERERRRAEVERGFLAGRSAAELAQDLDCSLSTVNRDLGHLCRRWAAEAERDCRELMGQVLAEVDHLKQEYWQGYERSLEPRETSVSSRTDSARPAKRVSLRREPGRNSADFLDGVGRCLDRKIKLLGLSSDVLRINAEPSWSSSLSQLDEAQLDAEFRRLLDGLARPRVALQPGDTLPPGFEMPWADEALEGDGR